MPIANTGLLLLNKSGKQVPYGASGEICIYGAGVGIGYKGRKEETEKSLQIMPEGGCTIPGI